MRQRMHSAAQVLVGEHDFSAFRAIECQAKSPLRRVERLEVTRDADWLTLAITANAFLHHMVRNVAGLLMSVGHGESPPERVAMVLASRDRKTQCRDRATGRPVPRRRPLSGRVRAASFEPAAIRYHRPHFGIGPISRNSSPTCPGSRKSCPRGSRPSAVRVRSPKGLWIKCSACDAVLYRAELERNLNVCPKCSHHMRIGGRERLARFLDEGEQTEIGANVSPEDPLKFRDSKRYRDRLAAAQKVTGERDALIAIAGTLEGLPIVACAFEFKFLGGSMGSVVGERFKRAVDHCIQNKAPLVCFSSSGGARMQEALFSLLQMAKTSAALARLAQARLPFISVLTDPTTGGVSASLAMLGDLNVAEPRALIGFAGPRVIQQTVRETLPEGFQRSEFLLDHGALDLIVDRRDMRERLGAVLRMLMRQPAAVAQPASAPAQLRLRRMRSLAEWLEQQQKSHPSAIDLDLEPRARSGTPSRSADA